MRRVFAAILLIAVLAIAGGAIASTAYQAGVSTAVSTATVDGHTVVTAPIVVPADWTPYARRNPVITSSQMSRAPCCLVRSRSARRNSLEGTTVPMLPTIGSRITQAISEPRA